jgi:Restriction endonuclease S subunits
MGMMSNLPKGWTKEKLPQVAEVIMGQSPPSSTYNTNRDCLPFFQGKAEFGALYPSVIKYCNSPKKIAEAGDILISVRAPVGPTNLCKEKSCIGRGLAALRPNQATTTKYLLYYMRDIESWLSIQGTGSTFTAISKTDLKNVEILLAPLNEQRRIVAKLEKLLQKVDACKERLDKIPTILKRFRQSILAAACSGRLTEDWREKNQNVEPAVELLKRIQSERKKTKKQLVKNRNILEEESFDIPDSWAFCFFEDIAANKPNSLKAGPFGSSLTKSCYVPSGYKIYGQEQVIRGDHSYGDYYIDEEKFLALKTCEVQTGDILVSLVGTIGKVLIIPDIFEKGIINPRLIKITLFEEVSRKYIASFLSSTVAMNVLRKDSHGGTMEILNMRILKNLSIPLPPINEQQEIVRRVEALFKIADQIEERYNKARTYIDKLTQSILAKAFRGELVPRDPTDEPASELLKRIKEEKVKTETTAKSTIRGRSS